MLAVPQIPLARMHIVGLLRGSASSDRKRIAVFTGLAGGANAILLAIINSAAEHAASARPAGLRILLLYLIAGALCYVTTRAALLEAGTLLQDRLADLRLRIADKLRRADLRTLERLNGGEIDATLAQDIDHLSLNVPALVRAAQSAVVLVCCLFYIATISQVAADILTAAVALAIAGAWFGRDVLKRRLEAVHAREVEMRDAVRELTGGFAEIRLNADANDALYRRVSATAAELAAAELAAGRQRVMRLTAGDALLYGMLAVVILVLPVFMGGATGDIGKIAAATMFCAGAIAVLVSTHHAVSRAEIGLARVHALETRLDEGAAAPSVAPEAGPGVPGFETIHFQQATFSYVTAKGDVTFTTGPWDVTLRRGELVFLVGGAGAGKSTALKVICGLYPMAAGRLLVDGMPIERESLPAYRELFSAIFSDVPSRDEWHGPGDADPAAVQAHLAAMELEAAVRFDGGRFTTRHMSIGQRKRFAMIVSQLDTRPIVVFDEWAAEQDVHFRDVFYTEILPRLRREGRTVIVVSHDDKYWHLADRRIVMNHGAVTVAEAAL